MSENPYKLGIDEIRRFLPHRSPFLLVDRVLGIELVHPVEDTAPASMVGIKVTATKAVSFNEPYFTGHFPSFSIVPGVLILESMAQASCFSLYPFLCKDMDKLARDFRCIFVGVDGARFRRPVVPGDLMKLETVVTKCRGKLWAFHCVATVEGQVVAEADLLANLIANTGEETK